MAVKNKNELVRFGTSSFSSKDWVGPFYPEGTWSFDFIKVYANHFNTVEVDSSYYRIPSDNTIKNWCDKTPDDFIISAKFPRSIVHAGEKSQPDSEKVLDPDHTYRERDKFLGVMDGLGIRLGPLILQFPYFNKDAFSSAAPFMEKLDRFLEDLPDDFKYGVEIRNPQWLKKDFVELCRKHNVALVLVDQSWMPHGDEVEKMFDPVTTDFTYIRLLGDRQKIEKITKKWDKEVIDHSERMQRWVKFLHRMVEREIFALVYTNNHYAGHAPMTARRMREMFLSND